MDRIRKQITALKGRLLETLAARSAAAAKATTLQHDEEAAFKSSCDQLAKQLEQQQKDLEAAALEKRKRAEERWRRRSARTRNTCNRLKALFQSRLQAKAETWQAEQRKIHEQADLERKRRMDALTKERDAELAQLAKYEATAEELSSRIVAFARERRVRLDAVRIKESLEHITTAHDAVAREVTQRLTETGELLESSRRSMKRRMHFLIPSTVVLLAFAGVAFRFCGVTTNPPYVFLRAPEYFQHVAYVGAGAALVLIVILVRYFGAKDRVYAAGMGLSRNVDTIRALIERQKQIWEHSLDHAWGEADAQFDRGVAGVDTDVAHKTEENNRTLLEISTRLHARRDRLIARYTREKDAELARLVKESAASGARVHAENQDALARRQEENAACKRRIEAERSTEVERLAGQWSQILGEFSAFAKESLAKARSEFPPWPNLVGKDWALPAAFRDEVYTGDIQVNLKELVPECDAEGKFTIPAGTVLMLPVVLSYPLEGSLYVRAGLGKREEAVQILSGAIMRVLGSCPPAKAKLTIIDPVGLGQNFAALMHLADYDETLVNGRIWSESAHIEKRLTDLTEHMEKVIQKYLRNRYASIDEYNREAGQLAEPHRFLVIADFPAGFSELSLDRLASIATSGAQCGVYVLLLHDARQKLPPAVEEKALRRNGLAIIESGEGFIVDDPEFNRGKFILEAPPASAQVDALLNGVGKQCRDAARVEVPFEAASPAPTECWSGSSNTGIRLPLGKSGADRLQYLELGRGTAQHALVAGKTGSGKSNLFHVIITNAALWYSPQEVELYLIDFKKGVEFKTYAAHELPHARVIAIESDREFGLSVLRRVDKELARRGELFRQARVQDLPSYRKTHPAEPVARTLLIIDEFQEFFTEDDGVGQDAALLLDRIVRQGRAFGIHVILGSQTLGGTYTLAKSTLGQMAVRIALQCNESDSYLILSDDNAAARLLSRPGDAIYNDMSGQIEGNNPFQVVFLPKDVQDACLSRVQQQAKEGRARPAAPTVVFEGSNPAELRSNPLLRDLMLHGRKAADTSVRVWLGEANAIKGPTELEFVRQAGRNVLVIGQRADSGLAMCCSTVLCLAASHAPEDVRICILDGSVPESGARERLEALAAVLPHEIEIVDYRRVPQVVGELGAELKSRQEAGAKGGKTCYLIVLGLQRFRTLRQEEDYGFPSSEEKTVSPAQSFADLLTDGPREGLYSLVWCDTLGNLNRTLNRRTLREFEMRVLFQMSSTDSSELTDSPAANRLGLYNALLFTVQDGGIEKFRPYATPDAELVEEFGRMLRKRFPSVTSRPAE